MQRWISCVYAKTWLISTKRNNILLWWQLHVPHSQCLSLEDWAPVSLLWLTKPIYHQISNISHTLVGNKIVYHSDVVGASPVGAAPTTSSFSTYHQASIYWTKTTARRDEKHSSFGIWCTLYSRFDGSSCYGHQHASSTEIKSQKSKL